MIEISGDLYNLYTTVNKLDQIKSISRTPSSYETKIQFYNKLVIELNYNGVNSIANVYKDYGINETIYKTFSIINDKIIDFIVVGNSIILVSKFKAYFVNISTIGEETNFTSPVSINTLGNGINYNIKLKYFNDIVYFVYYNYIYKISTTDRVFNLLYTSDYFITDCEIVKIAGLDTYGLINNEVYSNKSIEYINLRTGITISTINTNNSSFILDDYYIETAKSFKYLNGYIYVSKSDGSITKIDFDIDQINYNPQSTKLLFNTTGSVERILSNSTQLIFMTSLSEIYVYDSILDNSKLINVDHKIESIICNNALLSLYTNNSLLIYKLIDLPDLSINYTHIEKKLIDGTNGNNSNFFINCNTTLKHSISTKKDNYSYEVTLIYRDINEGHTIFQESNQTKNIYIPIIDKNIINSERSFKLSNDKIYYKIVNNELGIILSNIGSSVENNDILNKIFLKDVYSLDGDLFFRMRYILTSSYTLVTEVNDNRVVIVNNDKGYIGDIYEVIGNAITIEDYNTLLDNGLIEMDTEYVIGNPLAPPGRLVGTANGYETLYDYNEDTPYLSEKYYWFKISNIDYQSIINFSFIVMYNGTIYDTYEIDMDVIQKNSRDIKYKTTDNELMTMERLYLTELEQGNKTEFLRNMSSLAYEELLDNSKISIKKDPFIGYEPNDELTFGYMFIPLEYDSKQYKSNTLIADIYINGKKLFRKFIRQTDSLEGLVYLYYPIRKLVDFLSIEDFDYIVANNVFPNSIKILASLSRKELVSSEEVLCKYKLTNNYNNDIQMVQTTGIYIPYNIPNDLTINQIRCFIQNTEDGFLKRINPRHLDLEFDRVNNQILVRLNGISYIKNNSILYLVTNGIIDKSLFYTSLDDSYNIDSLPLITFDDQSNIYTNYISKAEDIEVIIDGLVLTPYSEYAIVDTDFESVPSLIVFKNIIPKDSIIEINHLNEEMNYVKYFNNPAEGTNNIFTLDDDTILFIDNTFEVFIDNLRISKNDISIINSKSIRIDNHVNIKNVMIRFSYINHTNLKLIMDEHKYINMNANDSYYHSSASPKFPSNFDLLCQEIQSKDIGKLLLIDKLNDNVAFSINTNRDGLIWDIVLDSDNIDGKYISSNIFINANRKIDNPINPLQNPQI